MKRWLVLIVGVLSYAFFFCTFLYSAGFLGNFLVPKSIDSGAEGPLGEALLINGVLLTVFAVQHSVMARPGFKAWWTKFVPAPLERPVYVLASSVALALMYWLWRPMGGTVWQVENPLGVAILYGVFTAGWLIVLVSTFLINHFDLFGLRQVWLYFRGEEYSPLNFSSPWPYRVVRHPLYVGWLTAFWATPTMTIAHLVFALATTAYILVAIRLEEKDLVDAHGSAYEKYRQRVPMLIPGLKPKSGSKVADESSVAAV